jgi:hypothetical protein
VYIRSVQRVFFFKKLKKERYRKESRGSRRAAFSGCRKETERSAKQRGTRQDEEAKEGCQTSKAASKSTVRRDRSQSPSSTPQQGSLKQITHEVIKKTCRVLRYEYYKGFFRTDALSKMYDNVTEIRRVEVPAEFINRTFIRLLMVGTGETPRRNERVHVLHENHKEYRFNGTRHRDGADIYTYGVKSTSRT